jgi:hypothetical protein
VCGCVGDQASLRLSHTAFDGRKSELPRYVRACSGSLMHALQLAPHSNTACMAHTPTLLAWHTTVATHQYTLVWPLGRPSSALAWHTTVATHRYTLVWPLGRPSAALSATAWRTRSLICACRRVGVTCDGWLAGLQNLTPSHHACYRGETAA